MILAAKPGLIGLAPGSGPLPLGGSGAAGECPVDMGLRFSPASGPPTAPFAFVSKTLCGMECMVTWLLCCIAVLALRLILSVGETSGLQACKLMLVPGPGCAA